MKTQLMLVLFVFGAFAVAEGARYVQAQTNVNPSQTTTGQDPSQTAPGSNPVRTPQIPNVPAPSPSNPPNPALPGPTGVTVPAEPQVAAPNEPQARRKLTDRQLTAQVRTAILKGANAVSGSPAFATTGIPVTGLKIKMVGGKAILSGVVRSEKEKADAGALAAGVAGEQNVVNELIVR